jgi:hypothetical protein
MSRPSNDTPSPAPARASSAATRSAPSAGPVVCGDLDMRIARDGTWYYRGSPIARERLVKLFASVLRREPDGSYYLVTPVEKGLVEVEDAPFVAVEMWREGDGPAQLLHFRTNLDDHVTADSTHPIRVSHDSVARQPTPYVLVRGGLEALIARSVYYDLVDLGVEIEGNHDHVYGVWSAGIFFPLGRLDAANS